MAPDDEAEHELEELHERQQHEVLRREGVEEELMEEGHSELGEDLDDVQDEPESTPHE